MRALASRLLMHARTFKFLQIMSPHCQENFAGKILGCVYHIANIAHAQPGANQNCLHGNASHDADLNFHSLL